MFPCLIFFGKILLFVPVDVTESKSFIEFWNAQFLHVFLYIDLFSRIFPRIHDRKTFLWYERPSPSTKTLRPINSKNSFPIEIEKRFGVLLNFNALTVWCMIILFDGDISMSSADINQSPLPVLFIVVQRVIVSKIKCSSNVQRLVKNILKNDQNFSMFYIQFILYPLKRL